MIILSYTAVERRVRRLGISYRQLGGATAVRRRVNARVVYDVYTVSLPATYINISSFGSAAAAVNNHIDDNDDDDDDDDDDAIQYGYYLATSTASELVFWVVCLFVCLFVTGKRLERSTCDLQHRPTTIVLRSRC